MIYTVKKEKPHKGLIKALRESINCTQSELLDEMEKLGYEISRRTYQKIEKGEKTQRLYLERLTKFYAKKLPANHIHKNIQIEDLILDPTRINVANIKQLDQDNLNKKKQSKDKIRKNNKSTKFVGVLEEDSKAILYKINNYEEITKNISASAKRKFYYKMQSSNDSIGYIDSQPISSAEVIKRIVSQIDNIKKLNFHKSNEEFGNAKNEFAKLNEVTEFSEHIRLLEEVGISLYAGLLYLPQYNWKAVSTHPANDYYQYQVDTTIYTIFCFKNDKEPDLIFHYQNVWTKDRLNYFLNKTKRKFIIDNSDENSIQEGQSQQNDFVTEIKYFYGIDDSKVSFDHAFSFSKTSPFNEYLDDLPMDPNDLDTYQRESALDTEENTKLIDSGALDDEEKF